MDELQDVPLFFEFPEDMTARQFGQKLDLAVKFAPRGPAWISLTIPVESAALVAAALKQGPQLRLVEVPVRHPLGLPRRVWAALLLTCLMDVAVLDPAGVVAAYLQGLLQ